MPQRASVTDSPSSSKIKPEYAVRGGVLRTHVDHDPLVATLGLLGHQGVPVLAGHGVNVALGRIAASGKGILLGGFVGRVGGAHEYDLL